MPLSPLEVALTGLFGHKPACLAELKDIISLLCKYGLVLLGLRGMRSSSQLFLFALSQGCGITQEHWQLLFSHAFFLCCFLCARAAKKYFHFDTFLSSRSAL